MFKYFVFWATYKHAKYYVQILEVKRVDVSMHIFKSNFLSDFINFM
jgi:hypothetical protein